MLAARRVPINPSRLARALVLRTEVWRRFATGVDQPTADSSTRDYDIVIVGGGPAGLALASALASYRPIRESLSIALIEAGDLSNVRKWAPEADKYSNRVSSITNASREFLSDIGVWSHVRDERTTPVEDMKVWDGLSDARIEFSPSDLGLLMHNPNASYEMARMTENINLQHALLKRLDERPEVHIMDKVKVDSIEQENAAGGWPVVGADGFNSPVKSFAKTPSYGWAYDTHAIVATLFHSAPSPLLPHRNTTASQRFLPTGPIAFLPLSPTISSVVWSTRPSLAAALKAAHPDVVAQMINAAFRLPDVSMRYLHSIILEAQAAGTPLTAERVNEEIAWRERSHAIDSQSPLSSSDRAGAVGIPPVGSEEYPPLVTGIQPGTIASFPIRLSHAESYIGEGAGARTALVGDAAHTIHPLAGQGLNMGLADVQVLAETINKTVLQGGDVGSYTSLLPYARDRYFENHKLLSITDKLHKLYSLTNAPSVWARSVGLEVVNELDSLKGGVASRASGSRSGAGWSGAAATGLESVIGGVETVKAVASGVGGVVGAATMNLLRQAANSK
ncbi:hypothetical protein BOTBODRAFT_45439 [Botryobasidium botryosum FD-172 SS1]|uniref:Ubiquinone biosynthesis monooxygenase COQ6, mitochondrial n=1 Tax=Botryobasidium botryosum (strain FD-172 SS1) TaxID=930990 RepID=A0A067MB57_BOTB1|nr:hypothetical protein BOTBODRAFT_45439 [Botryobasidium botryosum FD-172 SS1]